MHVGAKEVRLAGCLLRGTSIVQTIQMQTHLLTPPEANWMRLVTPAPLPPSSFSQPRGRVPMAWTVTGSRKTICRRVRNTHEPARDASCLLCQLLYHLVQDLEQIEREFKSMDVKHIYIK